MEAEPEEPPAGAGAGASAAPGAPLDLMAEETKIEKLKALLEGDIAGHIATLSAVSGIAAAEILAEMFGPPEGSPADKAMASAGGAESSAQAQPSAPSAEGSLEQALREMEALVRGRLEVMESQLRQIGADREELRDELPESSSISEAESEAGKAKGLESEGGAEALGAAGGAKPPEGAVPAEAGAAASLSSETPAPVKEMKAGGKASRKTAGLRIPSGLAAPPVPTAPEAPARAPKKNGSKRLPSAEKRPSTRRTRSK